MNPIYPKIEKETKLIIKQQLFFGDFLNRSQRGLSNVLP